jgi:ATP/maltotriose-dependent transcriptional regulator MalT/DNA-binding SARP family transcriptional activator
MPSPNANPNSGLIDRPRLLNKLQRALEHRLTLISAPPGYGKTTLAAQFARQAPYPVVWHTLDESQRDLPVLYQRALSLLEPIAPGIQSLPAPYGGYQASELAGLIIAYLRDHLDSDFIYIIDDVQLLAGSAPVETWLRTLVGNIPTACHLILLSRIIPDLPLTEMISRREVLAIGQEELRLTVPEIHNLGREMLGSPLADSKAQELVKRLEGWPAGTVLALHPLPPDMERAMLREGVGPEALFDGLADSMLNALNPGLRDFLLASSTLTRLTPEICKSCLELTESALWLSEIISRNLFLTRTTGGFVYHSLFRTFLQSKLKEADPQRFINLHTRAGRWFEEQDLIPEAFDHYIAAERLDYAVAISERAAEAYFTQGKAETLLNWGSKLQQVGARVPRLSRACAKIFFDRYEYEAAEAKLKDAEAGFMSAEDEAGIAEIQTLHAMLDLQRGNYEQASLGAKEFLETNSEFTNLRGRALTILGMASLYTGDPHQAALYLEEALPIYREDGDAYATSQLLQNLELVYTRLGRLNEAAACLQEVVALRRSLGSAGALALALNNLGYYYHQHSDYKQALATFQEGLSVVSKVPNRRAESYLLWSLGDLQRDLGVSNEAVQIYNKALELLGNSEPTLRCSILISFSMLRRWQGNFHEAATLAAEAGVLAQKHSIALEGTVAQANLWCARAYLEQADVALAEMETTVEALGSQAPQNELLRVLVLCAQTALLCADKPLAEQYLQSAVRIAHDMNTAQNLAAEVLYNPSLEAIVNSNSTRYSILMRDLNRLREAQDKITPEVRPERNITETYSLKVTTFGREIIERNGVRVPSSEWRATGARELFLYLLFMGPETRERICLAFWPDGSPKRVRQSFHTTLYRARQALGENAITFEDDLYQINPELDLWCDAREFENLAKQTRLLSPRDARTEDLWHKAVSLYRGEFLPSITQDWAAARRDVYHETYLEALIGLAECARARKNYREAILAFKRALELEPYREDIHRAIMTCYANLGEKKQIHAHLHRLQELFRHDLAVEPSTETITHAKSLLD